MSDSKPNILKGELLNYGYAPYKDDPTKSQSFFVQLRHDDGVVKKEWGVDLERALNESDVQIGDTVILNDKGRQPVSIPDPDDPSKSKKVTKRLWEIEKYEPVLDLPNVIEHDSEREQQKAVTADKTKENEQGEDPKRIKKTPDLSEFEWQPPDNIKNNYVAVIKNRHLLDQKTNYYDKDDKQQVNIAFEDRNKSLHTSRQDEKTIYAMLDMAQAKGWTAISLKGTEEFKQKAWLEASLRGIEVKGYDPSEKDMAELKLKQAERTTNQVDMTAQKPLEPKQETEQVQKVALEQSQIKNEQLAKNQVAIISQSLPSGDVRGYLWVAEEKSFTVGSFDQDDIMAFVEPYSKERALQYGIDEQKINRIEDMLKNGEIELYKKVVVEPTAEELKQLEANRQQWGKDQDERLANQQAFDDKYFNNLPIEQREAILNNIQNGFKNNGVDWRFKAFESSRKNFDGTLASLGAGTWAVDVVRERIADNEVQKPMSIKGHTEGNPQNNPENNLRIEIRQLFQNGYRDGLIKSRDDLVMALKERGFEVKENKKSITVTSIDSNQSIRLTNEVFTKLVDNVKGLKDRLEPSNIKQNYPSLKDSDVVHITAYQNKITDDFKASNSRNPAVLQAQLQQLESGVKDMAQGKEMNLPNLPVNERMPNIEVRTTDNHDKSRQV